MREEIISDKAQDYVSRLYAENEYPCGLCDIESDVMEAFEDGANWRIAAAWHDMKKEVPQACGKYEDKIAPPIPCLVKGYLSSGFGYGIRYWNVAHEVWDDEQADDYECGKDKIECWAYLADLLPGGKGE